MIKAIILAFVLFGIGSLFEVSYYAFGISIRRYTDIVSAAFLIIGFVAGKMDK